MNDEAGWKLIGFALMLLSAAIMIFCVIGVYDSFWHVPTKNAAIHQLSRKNELLRAENRKIKAENHKLKMGMRFENLWLLTADEKDKMDFSMIEDMLSEKRGLCK